MGVLSNLEPERVFHFFEEICSIPHGSGNIGRISDYLVSFARQRGLRAIQDEVKNVILFKEATPGYEDQPTMILQGHMDMVAVKKPDCDIDMKTEGLRLIVEGDKISAQGTSLGGDDGIAVAYALALLDSDTIRHPRLEVVITVDEEVGMDGAREIDLSCLTGNRLLNLDSEEEGIFLTSCAGGARVDGFLPVEWTEREGIAYEVILDGLQGGHSGAEIHKERGNSNCLMGRILYRLAEKMPIGICELSGGLADNAIPRTTRALLVVDGKDSALFAEVLDTVTIKIAEELAGRDPGVRDLVREMGKGSYRCTTPDSTVKCASYLFALPNGVQAMSMDIPGLVETSLNLGIIALQEDGLHTHISVRSSVESAKYVLIGRLEAVTSLAGGSQNVRGDYPGWQYRVKSPLREKMIRIYREMYGTEPKVEAIHAGLECGLLGSKIDDLDCVSIGPDMKNIHTTEEALSINSTARVWEYLVRLLEEKE